MTTRYAESLQCVLKESNDAQALLQAEALLLQERAVSNGEVASKDLKAIHDGSSQSFVIADFEAKAKDGINTMLRKTVEAHAELSFERRYAHFFDDGDDDEAAELQSTKTPGSDLRFDIAAFAKLGAFQGRARTSSQADI